MAAAQGGNLRQGNDEQPRRSRRADGRRPGELAHRCAGAVRWPKTGAADFGQGLIHRSYSIESGPRSKGSARPSAWIPATSTTTRPRRTVAGTDRAPPDPAAGPYEGPRLPGRAD